MLNVLRGKLATFCYICNLVNTLIISLTFILLTHAILPFYVNQKFVKALKNAHFFFFLLYFILN